MTPVLGKKLQMLEGNMRVVHEDPLCLVETEFQTILKQISRESIGGEINSMHGQPYGLI